MMILNTPERAQRIATTWARRPGLSESEVSALVDAELAAEAEAGEQRRQQEAETAEAFDRMFTCPVCGRSDLDARTGVCGPCSAVWHSIVAEQAGAEVLDGQSRRQRVEAYLDRQRLR